MNAKSPFERLHLLVVDDNAYMRNIIETVLHAWGIEKVSHASDGGEALERVRSEPIDIVLCDLNMEAVNGFEFARAVRTAEDSPNPFLPIIMVTGNTDKETVIAARDIGINEFLAKPVSAKQIYERLLAVIEQPRPYIRATEYFGPDRRRRAEGDFKGSNRRGDDVAGADTRDDDKGLSRERVEELLRGTVG